MYNIKYFTQENVRKGKQKTRISTKNQPKMVKIKRKRNTFPLKLNKPLPTQKISKF